MFLDLLKKQDINRGLDEFKTVNGAVLLDVRTSAEYREGHVPGSKNIDVAEIGNAIAVIEEKTAPIFVCCLSGARSARAVSALKSMGYTNAKNIGGISAYSGQVEKGA